MQSTQQRHDIYYMIHKALRLRLGHTLQLLGSTDWAEPQASQAAQCDLQQTLDLCASHLQHENEFIHPALENHYPGTSRQAGHEHGEHQSSISNLRQLAQLLADSSEQQRTSFANSLYQQFALFVGENLCHMHQEETAHNAVLWHAFSDVQILQIEQQLLASIPPAEKMEVMPWMLRAATPAECQQLLQGVRAQVPAEAWPQIRARLLGQLSNADLTKLQHADTSAQAA